MSADNWACCPRCTDARIAAVEELERKMDEAYGKVDREAYKALEDAFAEAERVVERWQEDDSHHTFREDYEIYGATEGVIRVGYKGACTECGLSVRFTHEESFYEVKS